MIDGLVAGRLYSRAEQRVDKAGKAFTVAKVRATVAAESELMFVNVIVFESELRERLSRLDEGDALTLSGSLTPRVWVDKQGNSRPALDMVAHRILSLDQDR